MKNGALIIYVLTILSVMFNLLIINVFLKPENFNILVKLGIFNSYNEHNITNLAVFILIFSFFTCILLVLSFILVIKKLLSMNKRNFTKI